MVDSWLPSMHGFHSESGRAFLGPSEANGCNGEDLLFPSSLQRGLVLPLVTDHPAGSSEAPSTPLGNSPVALYATGPPPSSLNQPEPTVQEKRVK